MNENDILNTPEYDNGYNEGSDAGFYDGLYGSKAKGYEEEDRKAALKAGDAFLLGEIDGYNASYKIGCKQYEEDQID